MKKESQPLSQSVPTDISVPDFKDGKMCPSRALGGIIGSIKSAVWLEVILLASGISTPIPGDATCLFSYGASTMIKFPVVPLSRMAWFVGV